ncbi:MAG: RNA polymerase sporulation sigma factor SigK [Lachnospiraceae bacterium]|nr:RNA polymerase sporulation sigma factor SigK [Lachnospiraceae bacterium]
MKTFEKPLTAEEETCYIQMLQDPDSGRAEEARQILIERNMRLVAHIARKYQNADEDMEDLISIGTIGLIKAVSSYDSTKGSRLATYAARCIDNELLMLLRKKKNTREVSLYEPIGTDKEGNEISLLDIIEHEQKDVVESITLEQNIERLYELSDRLLSNREKEILYLRYGMWNGEEATQREIGARLGISRSYVSRIEKRALKKLRDGFDKNNTIL